MSLKFEPVLEEKTDSLSAQARHRAATPLPRGHVGAFSGEILINCPTLNKPVSTGLKTEWVVFESLPPVDVPLHCPACGRTHKWKPADAWIGPHCARRNLFAS